MNKIFRFSGIIFLMSVLILCGCKDSQARWEQLYRAEGDETAADADINGDDKMENDLQGTQEDTTGIEDTKQNQPAQQTENIIYVHICGAVVSPGVYELSEGARVIEVIQAAGGLTEDADTVLVNQAKIVEDGEQIRIYTKEEAKEAGLQINADAGMGSDGKVNINTAGTEALMTLSGIGEAKAEAIIEYREVHGSFKTIEDLMNIPGIKQAVFSKIRDKITV